VRCAWALLAAAGLAACTVGPDYRRPEVATPPAYAEAASTPRTAVTPADADLSAWWAQFGDPELSSLVARALAGNLDRQTAISRVRQARLSEIVARAAEYPSLSAAGNALTFNSNRKSGGAPAQGTGPPTAGAGGLPIPSHLNLYSAGFDATWEVDLFGATRRAIEEARANTGAALWARRDGEVTLTAEVASDYLGLRMLQARIAIGEAELARQKGVFALIRARRQAGFVTSLDVNQQTTVVETAAAQLPQLEAQAKVQVHALAILMGEPPEGLAAELGANAAALPAPPPTLPVGLPSELLRRRPDIREAERRLAAANAGIGVQVASLYPKLDLIGLAAFAGTSLGDLFSIRNLSSAALAMASQPVFDAGRRRASVGIAREETVQASLAYQAAVLGALRDVEDALARYRSEETRREALERYLVAASNSLTIAQDQYRTGFVTFINVLQAQNAVLGARDQLAQSDAQVLADLVAIYKALGGGWST
jgi:NodT family efflux transporter outer membrane factor (OMF) lipoprotein